MPVNRNALIRYKTIDKCLQNRYRKWTLDDLIDACSDALYEYEGIDKGVSKRTVQGDIQMMRSDKLGYNAPIVVEDKKYYSYADKDYSITNSPLTEQDLHMLSDAVEFMKQFKGFAHFRQLDGMVQKLEDHIYAQKTQRHPVIDFEKNEDLKGLEYLNDLYKAIIQKEAVLIGYQSFKALRASDIHFSPFLLKEYRNRWFLIGKRSDSKGIVTLALDRIQSLQKSTKTYQEAPSFDAVRYYKDTIGVTVSPTQQAQEVILQVHKMHAPYVLTKPLHPSQQLIEEDSYGCTISLKVQLNFELEKVILGLGEGVQVLAPKQLKNKIKTRQEIAVEQYQNDWSHKGIVSIGKKLKHRGYAQLNRIYTQRHLNKIQQLISRHFGQQKAANISNTLLEQLPALKSLLLNKNLYRVLQSVAPEYRIVASHYYPEWPKDAAEPQKAWYQSAAANQLMVHIWLDDWPTEEGPYCLLAGSHRAQHAAADIVTISQNCLPEHLQTEAAHVLLLNSWLLRKHNEIPTESSCRLIQLLLQ